MQHGLCEDRHQETLLTILYYIIAWYAGQGSMSCLPHPLTLYKELEAAMYGCYERQCS